MPGPWPNAARYVRRKRLTSDTPTAAAAARTVARAGDRPRARARAAGGDTWTLGGRYDARLARNGRRWRIAAIRMTPVWQIGNGELMQRAGERAAARATGAPPSASHTSPTDDRS
ncbi:MAG: hypothetical protein ACFCVG_04210 [Kineosporiaceae bacterium]